jgi:gamma-glutamyltranspeptidase/glutathione hydrolase
VFRQEWPSSAEVWLRDGVPAPRSRFRNPALAATYRRIVDEAESRSSVRDEQIQAARDVF